MDLWALRSFVAVADHGSFTLAAARLRTTQPTLSRHVRSLENELTIRLFDRLGRRVKLTRAGEELLARARRLLEEADSLKSRGRELAGGSTGHLKVGATAQTLESLVSPLLSRFRRAYPNVTVQLSEGGTTRLLRQVESGGLDVALATLPVGSSLRERPLFLTTAMAVIPLGHRLAARVTLAIGDLRNEPLLLQRPGFITRQLFETACQAASIQVRVLLESSSPHCLLALADHGHGVAVVPSTVRALNVGRRAIPLHHAGTPLSMWTSAIWNPNRYASSARDAFINEAFLFTRRKYPGMEFHRGDPHHPKAIRRPGARVARAGRRA